MMAVGTTPWLETYFTHARFLRMLTTVGGTSSMVVLALSLLAEYLYVTKTRFLLRCFVVHSRPKSLLALAVLDMMTTYLLLLLTMPFIIIVMLYVSQIADPEIDIARSIVSLGVFAELDAEGRMVTTEYPTPFSAYDLSGYCQIAYTSAIAIYSELYFKFRPYILLIVASLQVSDPKTQQNLVVVPFTTFAASAFATTIWISGWWVVTMSMATIYRVQYSAGNMMLQVHRSSYVVFAMLIWLGIGSLIAAIVTIYLKLSH